MEKQLQNQPIQDLKFPNKVQDVSCSDFHIVIITEGRVRSMGSDNRTGRMGLGLQLIDKKKLQEEK